MEEKKDSNITRSNSVLNNPSLDLVLKKFQIDLEIQFGNDMDPGILKRTSKVLEALFYVSEAIPRDEKLRDKIRSKALDFFTDAVTLFKQNNVHKRQDVLEGVVHLAALLETARMLGFISPGSVVLVVSVLTLLSDQLTQLRGVSGEEEILKDIYKGHHKSADGGEQGTKMSLKQRSLSYKPVRAKSKGLFKIALVKEKIAARRTAVLDFVKDKQRVTVKDIQEVVKGFSQKTLQRELLALVASGVLKKEGERRWSVYSLRINGAVNGRSGSPPLS
jgi:DNA-binding transcriptional ArsR family regulator